MRHSHFFLVLALREMFLKASSVSLWGLRCSRADPARRFCGLEKRLFASGLEGCRIQLGDASSPEHKGTLLPPCKKVALLSSDGCKQQGSPQK